MTNTDNFMQDVMGQPQASIIQKVIEFYPHEIGLLMHLENQPDASAYIKDLIRQDLESEQEDSGSSFMDTLISMIEEKNQEKK